MLTHQNVTAAARDLGLSQSALSSALGRLRRHYGDPLFLKTGAGMLPTPRARRLAVGVRQALALIDESSVGSIAFECATCERTFHCAMSDIGEAMLLPLLMRRLRQLSPRVKLETFQLSTEMVMDRLATGELDLAIGYFPQPGRGIEHKTMYREHFICMTHEGFPLDASGSIGLKSYCAASHVMIDSLGSGHKAIERAFERRGISPHAALRVPHFMVIPLIIANTDLIVTIPSRAALPFAGLVPCKIHPVPITIPSFDCVVCWHHRFAADPSIVWMRTLIWELFKGLVFPVLPPPPLSARSISCWG